MVKLADLIPVLKEQVQETKQVGELIRESIRANGELNERLTQAFGQKMNELVAQSRRNEFSNISISKGQTKRAEELEELIKRDNEVSRGLNRDLSGKLDQLIYLQDSNKEVEYLRLTAGTAERKIMFTKPVKYVRIAASAAIWVDFDRKAGVNVSRQMLAGEEIALELWVKYISVITGVGTSTVRILGLR